MVRERVGYFTPEQAREVWRWVQWLQKSAGNLQTRSSAPGPAIFAPNPANAPILAKNISLQVIPRFGCVQAVGTVLEDGQCYLEVDQPRDSFGLNGPYFFNLFHDCVDYSDFGQHPYTTVTAGPVINALGDVTLAAGTQMRPQADSWELEANEHGRYIVMGENEGSKLGGNVIKVKHDDYVQHSMIFETPVGGIAAMTGTTPGSATCNAKYIAGGTYQNFLDKDDAAMTATVYNVFGAAIGGSTVIIAHRDVSGNWIATAEDC